MMAGTRLKTLQLWDKDLVVPLFTGLKLAPGTAEYSKYSDVSDCMTDYSLGGIPFYNPSFPNENGPIRCSHCEVNFDSRPELVSHFGDNWHIANLQRRMESLPAIDQQTFDSLSELREEGESNSCDSGTDEEIEDIPAESDEIVMRKTPRVYFQNSEGKVFSIYRCVLMSKKIETSKENVVLQAMSAIRKHYWSIILMAGGHFAGAVYRGSDIIVHKTFHSYTVRAKQGGSQSSRDNKNATSHPKSAGAALRRYNEQSFAQHVDEILTLWKEHFDGCDIIFLQCSTSSKKLLFGQTSSLFSKDNSRVRTIPIGTKKPTMAEVKKIHNLLGQVVLHGDLDEFAKFVGENDRKIELKLCMPEKKIIDRTSKKKENIKMSMGEKASLDTSFGRTESDSISDSELILGNQLESLNITNLNCLGSSVEDDRRRRKKKREKTISEKCFDGDSPVTLEPNLQIIYDSVYNACRLGEISTLKALLEIINHRNFSEVDDSLTLDVMKAVGALESTVDLLSFKFGDVNKTLLHVASENGQKDLVWWLLESGCDPCEIDKREKTPYMVSSTKEVKRVFRNFRGDFPDKYDYVKAHIADPINIETEQTQKAKLIEKKKRQKKLKEGRQKERKKEEMRLQEDEVEKNKFLQLSDREKRALAAELRISQNVSSMKEQKPLLTVSCRCFQCGKDISSIVPFEYSNNKFCSTSCVREHRVKGKL